MTIDFYYLPGSPPCRSVLLAAKAVGVDLNLKLTNLFAGEHLTPEYLKMNPQHTIPTIDDGGFYLSESRAILGYLVDQYAKDDSLYPKDPKKRALVNQRLYFDMGTLYKSFADYYFPIAFAGASPDPEKMKKLEEAFGFLDKYLEGQQWAAGSKITIADFALVASVSSADIVGFDVSKYSNVAKWFEKCKKSISGYEELNHKGCIQLKEMLDKATKKWCCKRENNRAPDMRTSLLLSCSAALLLCCCAVLAGAEDFCAAGEREDGVSCGASRIDLYLVKGSAPCRAVLLAAKAVGVDLNLKLVDLRAKEHLTPQFLKMNPQHKVPTIDDNGFVLGESRAIMGYLVDQYAKNDSLYPKDAKKRALVNQRLYFDIGTLYQRFSDYCYPIVFDGAAPNQKNLEKLEEAFGVLDKILEGKKWVAGSSLTIADISLTSSVAAPVVLGFDLKRFDNVARWFDNCKKSIPEYQEVAQDDLLAFKNFMGKAKFS
ncbi:uncharacterized protein LOC134542717 [Bacillus rossius redtenbacheri]|uniref:uncharacterized protein LOC134542717 n=1 Tax=Bacillus rossius redtenbacheri TaxID=93214 RepID=UPI002FDEC240